jgi:hypothetical protein
VDASSDVVCYRGEASKIQPLAHNTQQWKAVQGLII